MSERNMGQVVPFRVNVARLRQGAYEHRRKGRPVEAVELLRYAARQEDGTAGWLHLAEELCRLGCHEQASLLLYRLLARQDAPAQVWLKLGYAQAELGRKTAALDCLSNFLHLEPYSAAAEDARTLAQQLLPDDDAHEPRRLALLVRRGLRSWERGQAELGEKQLRRAIRMAQHPGDLCIQLALLLAAHNRMGDALNLLGVGLRRDSENLRVQCAMAVAADVTSRPRMGLAFLLQAEPLCSSMLDEERLIATAWTMRAWSFLERYLEKRRRQQPCCIQILQHMAELEWVKGRQEMAEKYWQRVLRLDPDNMCTKAMVRWAQNHQPGDALPTGQQPRETVEEMLHALEALEQQHPDAETLLDPEGDGYRVVDWCFYYGTPSIQQRCLNLIEQDTPRARQFLREVLTHPFSDEETRDMALIRLCQWGETEGLRRLVGQQMTVVSCLPEKSSASRLWRMFRMQLVKECEYPQLLQPMLDMACKAWRSMSPKQRVQAAGTDSYAWAKTIEMLFLVHSGMEQETGWVTFNMHIPVRRVKHMMRILARQMKLDINMEG